MLLGIKERTAKFHVCNILHKLNVKRRKDVFGIGRGLLELRQTKECSSPTYGRQQFRFASCTNTDSIAVRLCMNSQLQDQESSYSLFLSE